jgi:AbrB family looped-hinge helix DNA binding protein
MRSSAIVSSKGQIVIPARLRKRYGITTGTTLVFHEDHGRLTIEPSNVGAFLALGGSMSEYDLEGDLIRTRAEERRREDEKLHNWQ